MKKIYTPFVHLIIILSITSSFASVLPTGFTEKRLATGLDPTGMAVVPDGRIFVTIKSGKVLIVKNDILLSTPLLTIPNVDNFNERGLLSLVLDPAFTNNNFIYVYYTFKNTTTNISNNRVSRFTVNGDLVVAGSELVLINFNNLSNIGWHNGGGLVYGADGKIYASAGENTNSANAQSMNTLLGKAIRINPDGSIPTDNPFYLSATGQNRAIYALGFRNPFRMKIQPGTGKIYLNDVGAGSFEEINELKPGKNYGWPNIEGKITNQTPPNNYEDPLYAYNHSNGACSITGGTFYNPPVQHFPNQYVNKYFFLDYCAGWIRYIDPANNYTVSNFVTGVDRGLDMAVDGLGNMYYLARGGIGGGSDADNTASSNGELWRITYTGNGNVAITVNPLDKSVATGATVTFVVSATGTAPITYQWKKEGINIDGATSQSYTIPAVALSDNGTKYSVIVANNASTQTSSQALLTVKNNTAPVPQILTPTAGTLYEAGTTINFSGSATDAEDGTLPASAFTWRVDFQHDTHNHPALDPASGFMSSSFLIPDEGEPSDTVWYRLYLTVVDAFGTKTTIFRDIYPKKVDVTLASKPSGIVIKLDGVNVTTPYTFKGVVGLKRTIQADNIISFGGATYSFVNWSNGGPSNQIILTPKSNTLFTVNYANSSTDTVSVVADAYVRGGTNANIAFGATNPNFLQTKTESSLELTRQTYLRFDISKNSNLTGAMLKLYGYRNSAENNNVNVGVYGVSNNVWNENTITWYNKPLADSNLLATSVVNSLSPNGMYYDWDVSDYVKTAKQNGATQISFLISNNELTSNYIQFNSKESGSKIPQLVVTYLKNPLGFEDINETPLTKVHPNPFSDNLTLESKGKFSYSVSDLSGSKITAGEGENLVIFNCNLNSGVYFVQINGNQTTRIFKVIKN